MELFDLQAEGMACPHGIDAAQPVFSWRVATRRENWMQSACRVRVVADTSGLLDGAALWDSGRVEDARPWLYYAGPRLQADTRYYWQPQLWDAQGESARGAPQSFTTGLLHETDWQGQWIGEAQDHVWSLLRTEFAVGKSVARASLFVCGMGHYELLLNGEKLGDRVLDPAWSSYDKRCLYASYDVTALLLSGANALGVMLGDGMFNVPGGRYVYYPRSYGKMKLLLQLNLHYADKSVESVTSGPHWRTALGPIRFCCMYGGEDYDARLEQPGWARPGFDASDWQAARVVDAPPGRLVSQTMPPVKVMERYDAPLVRETAPGVYLYDFGANFSGWARLRLHRGEALAGHVVSMIPGEILDRDGNPDQSVTGRGYHWQYTLNGEDVQEYAPKFTYTGFRYLQLRGAVPAGYPAAGQELPTAQTITGEFIYPDFAPAGGFTCSNPLFNSIHKIVTQAMKSNIKGYFTDCPHRERLPWMEQSHLIAPGLMYNFDLRRHYEKIMADIADAQHENGMVPTICPQYVRFGYHRGYNDSPEWGSAAVLNPWYAYLRTGDAQILRRGYAVMCRYVDYLGTQTHHLVLHHGLGDWLDIGPYPPHSQNTPVPVVATCIYHLDLTLVARIAALLGETADAEKYAALAGQVRAEFRAQFLDKQSVRSIFVANGSQAAQAMALMCGLIDADEEQATLLSLASDIEKRGYANTAGDVGHPFVVAALTRYGRGDLMEKMLLNDEQPGYAYQVKHGATTLTEDWDGPNPGGPHGSQNHFMLGAVEEWFYCGLAGLGSLRVDAFSPEMTIRPYFAESCDAVSAWTLHPCGRVAIQWKRLPRGIEVVLTVPPGLRVVFVGGAEDTRTALASGTHCLMLPV